MRKLREILKGTLLPPGAEEEIALAEQKQREEASYTQYLESRLESALGENKNGNEGHASMLRKEWEQSKGQSQGQHVEHLEEIKEKILVLLGQVQDAAESMISAHLCVSQQLAKFHLTELKNANLVHYASFGGARDSKWFITQQGRAYLVSHGLLQ